MTSQQSGSGIRCTLILSKKGKEIRARKKKEAEKKAASEVAERKRLDHL